MKTVEYDIAVIGGGAAGLTAGATCAQLNAKTIVIERNERLGGVLLQCIHNGFGIHYFKKELTGPEYAYNVFQKAKQAGVHFLTESTVMKLEKTGDSTCLTVFSHQQGIVFIHAKAVILAMGCRERCRGNLGIPGERTAGVFSAGTAQQLMNCEGLLPGHEAVIIGSGDIGLIMARRLTWCNVHVKCVLEIMPYPAGLSRNIAQCLEDFNIPLLTSTSVTGIFGKPRVKYVTYAPLVDGLPDLDREQRVDCDTVLFSVGLVPETEILRECGIAINSLTGGAWVDGTLMTSVEGIFCCGNGLHVHDLVDFVSREAERCAQCAVSFCNGNELQKTCKTEVTPGEGIRYVVPNQIHSACENHLFMRALTVMDHATLSIKDEKGHVLLNRTMHYVRPAEMLDVVMPPHEASILTVNLEKRQ